MKRSLHPPGQPAAPLRLARRRPDRIADGERGAAAVEFVAVFLTLLVPLVYAIAVMADVQRALLAVSTAAREVGRVYVTAPGPAEASERAEVAYEDVMRNLVTKGGTRGRTLRCAPSARRPRRPVVVGNWAREWR